MDKSVDQDLEAQASDDDESDLVVETGSEDIESELYSSTREAGMGAVAFGPVEGI
jgi:hypothetical protein